MIYDILAKIDFLRIFLHFREDTVVAKIVLSLFKGKEMFVVFTWLFLVVLTNLQVKCS